MKPISDNRRAENAEREERMVEAFGPREDWHCAIWGHPVALVMGPCFGPVNGHEIVKRSQGGSIVDTDNIVLLCNRHNDWVEDHPVEAKKIRLSRSAWDTRPEEFGDSDEFIDYLRAQKDADRG